MSSVWSSSQQSDQGLSALLSQTNNLSLSQVKDVVSSPQHAPPSQKTRIRLADVAPSASQCATSAAPPPEVRYQYMDDGPGSDDDGDAGANISDTEFAHEQSDPEVLPPTQRASRLEQKETFARGPSDAEAFPKEGGRSSGPRVKGANDVDLLAYVTDALKRMSIQQETLRDQMNRAEQEAIEHKHDAETFQNDAKWCGWNGAPLEAKVDFIQRQGDFGTVVNPVLVGKYLITLEQICASPNVAHAVELLYGPPLTRVPHADTRSNLQFVIQSNLAFCYALEHADMANTPFASLTQKQWDQRIFRLQRSHEQLVKWHKHMTLAREELAVGKPISPLYEAPAIDDENAQNQERDELKESPEQKLLEFMFQRAGNQGLRRTEHGVFKAIKTPDGHNTRCFEHLADMGPWMRDQVRPKSDHPVEYNYLTKKGDVPRYLLSHLGKQSDMRFPWLKRCRTLFSFKNGIYDANTNDFYVYVTTESQIGSHVKTVYDLPHDVATAKYYPEVVDLDWFKPECKGNYTYVEGKGWRTRTQGVLSDDEKGSWREKIRVTEHETIFASQGYSFENGMLDWAEAMLGRLCHEVGTLEDWATAVHLEGPAKTGKSLILKLIQLWYYTTDIGLIGDSVEQKFPDQHLIGKFIVMCMDVSREFGLSPTRFLLWCSGDWLEVHRKGLEAICMKWTAPSIWASNNKPPIMAAGGAAKRRYIILQFLKAVRKADAKLFTRATKEVGTFMIKCNMAYHEKIAMWGDVNLYDDERILPQGIRKAMKEYAAASSWADAFLDFPKKFLFWKDVVKTFEGSDVERKEQEALFRVSRQEFESSFASFKTSYKMEGVNKNREPPPTQCTATEFANALMERGCEWVEEQHGFITGLRFLDPEEASRMEADKKLQEQSAGGQPTGAYRTAYKAAQAPRPRQARIPDAPQDVLLHASASQFGSPNDYVPGQNSAFAHLAAAAPVAG